VAGIVYNQQCARIVVVIDEVGQVFIYLDLGCSFRVLGQFLPHGLVVKVILEHPFEPSHLDESV